MSRFASMMLGVVMLGGIVRAEDKFKSSDVTETFELQGATQNGQVLKIDLGGGKYLELVRIKAGKFRMGSPESDEDARDNEKPQHEVEIARDFYLGKFHVTRAQFAQFVSEEHFKTEAERNGLGGYGYSALFNTFDFGPQFTWKETGHAYGDDHPVVNVTWNDAVAYCNWLSKRTGRKVDLATEAEYEFASRGGTSSLYFSGDKAASLAGYANVGDKSLQKLGIEARKEFEFFSFDDGYAFTSPVGKFKPNPFGLYDMTGNVYSWCRDYLGDYKDVGQVKDPMQLVKQKYDYRIARGGSWGDSPWFSRVAFRQAGTPDTCSNAFGFRVVVRLQ